MTDGLLYAQFGLLCLNWIVIDPILRYLRLAMGLLIFAADIYLYRADIAEDDEEDAAHWAHAFGAIAGICIGRLATRGSETIVAKASFLPSSCPVYSLHVPRLLLACAPLPLSYAPLLLTRPCFEHLHHVSAALSIGHNHVRNKGQLIAHAVGVFVYWALIIIIYGSSGAIENNWEAALWAMIPGVAIAAHFYNELMRYRKGFLKVARKTVIAVVPAPLANAGVGVVDAVEYVADKVTIASDKQLIGEAVGGEGVMTKDVTQATAAAVDGVVALPDQIAALPDQIVALPVQMVALPD